MEKQIELHRNSYLLGSYQGKIQKINWKIIYVIAITFFCPSDLQYHHCTAVSREIHSILARSLPPLSMSSIISIFFVTSTVWVFARQCYWKFSVLFFIFLIFGLLVIVLLPAWFVLKLFPFIFTFPFLVLRHHKLQHLLFSKYQFPSFLQFSFVVCSSLNLNVYQFFSCSILSLAATSCY